MPLADDLTDKLLSRDIDLARLEASEQRAILAQLRQLQADLKARLASIAPTDPQRPSYQVRRLRKLQDEADTAITDVLRTIRHQQVRTIEQVASIEADTLADELNAAAGVDLFTGALDPARLKGLLDDVSVEGFSLREWWTKQEASLKANFRAAMRRGQLAGDSLSHLITRIARLMKIGERQAEVLVRTSLISVQNHTRNLLYEANADVLSAEQWITAMDTRVCLQCNGLAGKQWDVVTKEPIGHTIRWPGVTAHPQ